MLFPIFVTKSTPIHPLQVSETGRKVESRSNVVVASDCSTRRSSGSTLSSSQQGTNVREPSKAPRRGRPAGPRAAAEPALDPATAPRSIGAASGTAGKQQPASSPAVKGKKRKLPSNDSGLDALPSPPAEGWLPEEDPSTNALSSGVPRPVIPSTTTSLLTGDGKRLSKRPRDGSKVASSGCVIS